ncbi:odorant receptor 170 isoform X3 [Nasonia vitripennis]|uniref:Odorant receptor n=1 Tax=Nasonia vitripennis TaxID=7425 RepID=A0A7M7QL57_NASVI|nr:odorant receptor 170 isoform X3 [Nasonia vitripennis]
MELMVEKKTKSEIKEEYIFSNKYFIFNKMMLKSTGLWPYQDVWLKRGMMILYITGFFSLMIPQVIRAVQELYSENINLGLIIEFVCGIILYVALIGRILMLTLQKTKMRFIYEEITWNWGEINDSGERAVLGRFCNIGRILSIFYTGPMILNTFSNATYKKSICIDAEYFVDQDEYFSYIFSHTVFVSLLSASILTAFDSTFVLITQHGIGLLHVLKYRLNKISKIFEMSEYNFKDNTIIHTKIVSCIILHKKSLQFLKVIGSTYDLYHFFIYSLLLASLSIFTIDVVVNLQDFATVLRLLITWSALVMYMFYFNWPGQKIINSSEEIFEVIYLSNWYSYPLKTQKLIMFMLLRTGKRIFLKAGIFEMSFVTVGHIMKTAMSYFTVFISLL